MTKTKLKKRVWAALGQSLSNSQLKQKNWLPNHKSQKRLFSGKKRKKKEHTLPLKLSYSPLRFQLSSHGSAMASEQWRKKNDTQFRLPPSCSRFHSLSRFCSLTVLSRHLCVLLSPLSQLQRFSLGFSRPHRQTIKISALNQSLITMQMVLQITSGWKKLKKSIKNIQVIIRFSISVLLTFASVSFSSGSLDLVCSEFFVGNFKSEWGWLGELKVLRFCCCMFGVFEGETWACGLFEVMCVNEFCS